MENYSKTLSSQLVVLEMLGKQIGINPGVEEGIQSIAEQINRNKKIIEQCRQIYITYKIVNQLNKAAAPVAAAPVAADPVAAAPASASSAIMKTTGSIYGEGRWTRKEHEAFIGGYRKHGNNLINVLNYMNEKLGINSGSDLSRTTSQVRSHAQKYLKRLAKSGVVAGNQGTADTSGSPDITQLQQDQKLEVQTEQITQQPIKQLQPQSQQLHYQPPPQQLHYQPQSQLHQFQQPPVPQPLKVSRKRSQEASGFDPEEVEVACVLGSFGSLAKRAKVIGSSPSPSYS